MKDAQSLAGSRATFGDVTVDGLIAGVGAGILMAIYLVASGLLLGQGPGAVLGQFDPAAKPLPQIGALMHLAVSAIYGILFSLGRHRVARQPLSTRRSALIGLLYGSALFALAEVVLLRGTGSHLTDIPPVHFGIAHAIYGISLSLLVREHPGEERAYK